MVPRTERKLNGRRIIGAEEGGISLSVGHAELEESMETLEKYQTGAQKLRVGS